MKKLHKLYDLALKATGSEYALAIVLSGGDRQSKEFYHHLKVLKNKSFICKEDEYIKLFERVIKTNALAVATVAEKIKWFDLDGYKKDTLKKYYKQHNELFIKIGNTLYFIETNKILLENMFFRCVELAGGESALARYLSRDKKEFEAHRAAFRRMGFKHRDVFKKYSKLFGEFLSSHLTLFSEDRLAV